MNKKQSALLRIILYSLALIVLVGGTLVVFLYSSLHFSGSESVTTQDGSTELSTSTFSAEEFDSIEINWANGMITISPTELLTDTVTIKEVASSEQTKKMQLNRSGHTLQIDFCKSPVSIFGITSFKDAAKDLYIEVPLDWFCKELNVNAASVTVNMSHMEFRDAEFDLASGNLNMDSCKMQCLNVDTASGTLNFNGELEELECDAASANCNIQVSNHPNKIEFNSVSGDLELTLPESCGFSVEQDGLSVSFASEFSTTTRDGRYVYGDGSCKIEADSVSGDISIHKLLP